MNDKKEKTSYSLSPKYKAFLKHEAEAEFLEGTTAAGKTTVGILKFMFKVAESNKMMHVIAAKTTGVAEKNIIQKDYGILDVFGDFVQYNGNGDKHNKIPHIKYCTQNGDKIIYILGYDNTDKWKMALGSQFGCVYIDEINTASIDFVREICTRNDYLIATLNPDDPNLPVYDEFINRSRPLAKWSSDIPESIMNDIRKCKENKTWTYWFFTFYDNASLSNEEINKKKLSAPKGTKLYKNKIQGLRGRATGLVFPNFDRRVHLVSKDYTKQFLNKNSKEYFTTFTSGLDTSYSSNSEDTIAMSFAGITNKGNYFLLDEKTYNNKKLQTPIAPSDTARNYHAFLEKNRKDWGMAKDTFIDSADSATITELNKYKRENGLIYNFIPAWKKTTIVDRIILQNGWMNWDKDNNIEPCYYVLEHCKVYIGELEIYSWLEDKNNEPEDKNDHMINSCQYNWLPYKNKIGVDIK